MGSGAAAAVGRTFDMMAVAEEVILEAGLKKGDRAWGVFWQLYPGPLSRFSDELYRGHCRDLVARAIASEDLRPGTDAEVCMALHDASLRAPLRGSYVLAYEESFEIAMKRRAPGREGTRAYQYEGESAQIVADLRKRTQQEWRKI